MTRAFGRLLSLVCAAALLALAGCGGSGGTKPAPTAGGGAQQGAAAPAQKGAASGGGPVRGGTLTLAIANDFKSLDPALAGDGQTIMLAQLLFRNLLGYTGPNKNELTGLLAESWKWAPDGKGVTIVLREGLKFSDGSPLTADDVAYTVTRLLDPKTKAPYQGSFTVIEGAKDFIDGKAKQVAGIVVKDPRTIEFRLEHPAPYFLNVLALPSANVVSRKDVEANGAPSVEHFVGSGPFVAKEWKSGQLLRAERNPNYYRKGLPYLDEVVFKIGVALETQALMVQKGEVDVMWPVPASLFAKIESDPTLKQAYTSAPGPRIFYVGMNVEMPPFDDKRVRQAFNYAVDKKRIVQLMNGRGSVMGGVIPPWVPGYSESIAPYPYDPERAKAMLAEAGHGGGLTIDMLVPVFLDQPKIAAQVQSDLAKVGVKVNIRQESYPVFLQTTRQRKRVQMFALQWGTDFPDASNVMLLFKGENAGKQNRTWFNHPQVNKLIAEGDSTLDPQRRASLYLEAQKIIREEAPWIFEFYGNSDALRSPQLKADIPLFFGIPMEYRNFDEVWKVATK